MSSTTLSRLVDGAFPPVTTMLCRRMQPSLYRYVWRVSAPQQIRLCLLTAVLAPLAMAPLELQRRLVNEAIGSADVDLLLTLGGLYLAVIVVHGGLKYVRNLYQGRVAEGVVRVLRLRLAREAEEEERGAGTLVSMAAAEAEHLGGFVAESLAGPLLHLGTFLAVLGYMLWIEPAIAALALVLFVPTVTLVPLLQNRINRYVAERTRLMRELGDEMTGEETEGDDAYNQRIESIYATRLRIYALKFLLKAINNGLGHIGPLGILLFGGWLVIQGETELGTIVAFISGFERLLNPSRDLVNLYREFSRMRVQYGLFIERMQ